MNVRAWVMAALAILRCGHVAAAESALRGFVSLAGETDTNATRTVDAVPGDGTGHLAPAPLPAPHVQDALLRASTGASIEAALGDTALRADAALGLKLFAQAASERMVVAQVRTQLTSRELAWGFVLQSGSAVKVRQQASGARSYGQVQADAGVEHALGATPLLGDVVVRCSALGDAMAAFDAPVFSQAFAGALLGLTARAQTPDRLFVTLSGGGRGFPYASQDNAQPAAARRLDGSALLSVGMVSSRRMFLQGSYTLQRNVSNARGEAFSRHRLAAAVGTLLPAEVFVSAQGALQLTQYDDGVSLGQRFYLDQDEESQNLLVLSARRVLVQTPAQTIALDLRTALYSNELTSNGATFARSTIGVGLRADLR